MIEQLGVCGKEPVIVYRERILAKINGLRAMKAILATCLQPMGQLHARMATQIGAYTMSRTNGAPFNVSSKISSQPFSDRLPIASLLGARTIRNVR